MSQQSTPALSVVLVTPDCFETIRLTLQHLRAQTVREQIELVLVAPSAAALQDGLHDLQGFYGTRVVELGAVESVAQGNTAGARQATAPVVAFIEEHAYPDPTWAEALLRAHQSPWAAVGPVVRNAAPDSVVAWADHLVSYGPWMDPAPAGPCDALCWHNVSYKRELLLRYGDGLEPLMAAETILQWDLRSRGYELYLDSEAHIAHLGFTYLHGGLEEAFYNGRLLAGMRIRNFSGMRRLLYIAGAGLIPVVRLWRLARQLHHHPAQRHGIPIAAWPVAILLLQAGALGELLGYTFGVKGTGRDVGRYDPHRRRGSREHQEKP